MTKLYVVKIGTNSVFHDGGIDNPVLTSLGYDIALLKTERDTNVALVTSGSIALGMQRLGISERPIDQPGKLQQLARIGEHTLIGIYEKGIQAGFNKYASERKIDSREAIMTEYTFTYHHLGSREALGEIGYSIRRDLDDGFQPQINYNDGIDPNEATRDNDKHAAIIARATYAEKLILGTDVQGLLDDNGNLITHVPIIDEHIKQLAGDGNGVGGMRTKLEAVIIARTDGIDTIIGNISNGLVELLDNDHGRTLFPHI